MKKSEVVWFTIRLIGVYFIYLAVSNTVSFVGSIIIMIQTPELFEKSFGILFQSVLLIALYGVLGNYLIQNGSHLFTVLNREN